MVHPSRLAIRYLATISVLGPLNGLAAPLSDVETAKQVAYSALHYLDYRQTRNIAAHSELEEKNFFLGPHPSNKQINKYFATTLIAHWAITYAMPQEYRSLWQNSTIMLEVTVIGHNKQIGLSFNF